MALDCRAYFVTESCSNTKSEFAVELCRMNFSFRMIKNDLVLFGLFSSPNKTKYMVNSMVAYLSLQSSNSITW